MTEATYAYYATPAPGLEVFDCTTAPTNGLTLTSRKFVNPLVVGYVVTESAASDTGHYFTVSGSTITVGVFGTVKKIRVLVMEGSA